MSKVRSLALDTPRAYALTDSGNAERFAEEHRDHVRYVPAWRRWLVFDGRHWEPDARGKVDLLAKATVRAISKEAATETDEDRRKKLLGHALKSEARGGRENLIALARTELAAAPEDFDLDPLLFNVANGTIDLRTGMLRPHAAGDMITRLVDVPYDRAATCPTFDAFMRRVLADDPELVAYVQKAVGYSLSGAVTEQCFFFCHGDGANGKSTFTEVVLRLTGPYGKAAAPDLLMAREHDQHPAEQADLQGARVVICQEVAEGRSFNERTLKHLTGGDRIKARRMHADWFEFEPTHKIWICANAKPRMRDGGAATWRRVRLIPFGVVIPPEERDRELGARLRAELPGILRWAVEGCLRWQKEGLVPPAVVTGATDAYREESDHVATFADERLELGPERVVGKTELYGAYQMWCRANRQAPLQRETLSKRLQSRGLIEQRTKHQRSWVGASLRGCLPMVDG